MTTKTKTKAATTKSRPTHSVFQVIDTKDGNKVWNAVGAAWPHKDSKGYNIRLDAIPVPFDGQLTIRERTNKDEGEGR